MDKYDKATRSRMMAAVRSRGNRSTELRLAVLLRRHGLSGWRRHYAVAGTPDFCWPKRRVALFVDGCFWHGCPRCRRAPKSNLAFWDAKVAENRRRDKKVEKRLRQQGWTVLRVWECRINQPSTIRRIIKALAEHGPRSHGNPPALRAGALGDLLELLPEDKGGQRGQAIMALS